MNWRDLFQRRIRKTKHRCNTLCREGRVSYKKHQGPTSTSYTLTTGGFPLPTSFGSLEKYILGLFVYPRPGHITFDCSRELYESLEVGDKVRVRLMATRVDVTERTGPRSSSRHSYYKDYVVCGVERLNQLT